MTLGMAVRHLRQSAGISQLDLAERLEISASYLSQIENDRREASLPLLRKIASQFEAPSALLFALALAGSADHFAATEVTKTLEKLVQAVGYQNMQTHLSMNPREPAKSA